MADQRKAQWTLLEETVFHLFMKPGEVVEVRALGIHGKADHLWGGGFAKGTVAGYFDDHKAFCKCVQALDRLKHRGIYFTLQVIDPRLIGRAFNRLVVAKETTTDRDVKAFRWLPIDLDPVRPAGISSSETELKAALRLRDEIAEEISRIYELPAPVKAISGNGGHLLYRLPDAPPKEYAHAVQLLLNEIGLKFSTPAVTIDQAVHNPARIWKLYGTTARKGDEVPAGLNRETRLHRMAYIEDLPEWALKANNK